MWNCPASDTRSGVVGAQSPKSPPPGDNRRGSSGAKSHKTPRGTNAQKSTFLVECRSKEAKGVYPSQHPPGANRWGTTCGERPEKPPYRSQPVGSELVAKGPSRHPFHPSHFTCDPSHSHLHQYSLSYSHIMGQPRFTNALTLTLRVYMCIYCPKNDHDKPFIAHLLTQKRYLPGGPRCDKLTK